MSVHVSIMRGTMVPYQNEGGRSMGNKSIDEEIMELVEQMNPEQLDRLTRYAIMIIDSKTKQSAGVNPPSTVWLQDSDIPKQRAGACFPGTAARPENR